MLNAEDSGYKPASTPRIYGLSKRHRTGEWKFARTALGRGKGMVGGARFSRFLSLAAGAGESRPAGGPQPAAVGNDVSRARGRIGRARERVFERF